MEDGDWRTMITWISVNKAHSYPLALKLRTTNLPHESSNQLIKVHNEKFIVYVMKTLTMTYNTRKLRLLSTR